MRTYKRVLVFVGALAVLCLVHAAAQMMNASEVRSALSGTVTWAAAKGDVLPPGGELVRIKTLTGEAAAARVEATSEVVEVLVAPGDEITAGMVIAKVQPAEKK